MADPAVAPEEGQTQDDVDYKAMVEEQQTKLKQKEDDIKRIKDLQSGSDKKVAELMAEIEEMRKSQMKAEERREYERKQAEEKLQSELEAVKSEKVNFWKLKTLAKYNLDESFMHRITGETEGEIEDDIKSLVELMQTKYVQKEVTDRLTSGPKPTGGSGPSPTAGVKEFASKFETLPADEAKKYVKEHPDMWAQYVKQQQVEPG